MKLFRGIKLTLEEIWQNICNHKWRSVICLAFAVMGVIVGIIFVNIFQYSWWYGNRYEYSARLFEGGFGLAFSFLLWTGIFYLFLLCCCLVPQTKYLCCASLFVACFYCGANAATAIICWSVWGILFAILVSAAEIVGYCVACILVCCENSCNRTLREAVCDTKLALKVLAAAFTVKFVCFFVILRVITAVI